MPEPCSTKPLIGKLGIKGGFKVAFVHPPKDYPKTLCPLP